MLESEKSLSDVERKDSLEEKVEEDDEDIIAGVAEAGGGVTLTALTSSSSVKDVASTYQVRPNLMDRFRPAAVNELIHEVLYEELTGKVYSTEESEELTTKIASIIRQRVKGLALNRYKYMVQVVLAEQRGAGIVMGMRCLWDAETDSYASNQFLSDTIYGMAVVFAVYFY